MAVYTVEGGLIVRIQRSDAGHNILNAIVTAFGLTCKKDCSDIYNLKVIDIISELHD